MTKDEMPSRSRPFTAAVRTAVIRCRIPITIVISSLGLLLCRPNPASIAIGSSLAGAGLGLRGWAAGIIRKNTALAVGGPYAFCRHPLYIGNFLIAVGFGITSRSAILVAALMVCFGLGYAPLIVQEENQLLLTFGAEYERYCARVPRFLPRLSSNPPAHDQHFTWLCYWNNREYNALLGFCLAVVFLFAEWRLGR